MEKIDENKKIGEEKLSKSLLEKKERRIFNLTGMRVNFNGRSVATPTDTCESKDGKMRLKRIEHDKSLENVN